MDDEFRQYLYGELRRLQYQCQAHIENEREHGTQETVNTRYHEYSALERAEFALYYGPNK